MVISSESWAFNLLAFLIGLLAIFHLFLKWNYSYWDRQGIKTLPGYSYVLGHFKSNFPPKKSMPFLICDLYNATNEPYVGIYTLFRPVFLARDPELIKMIMIKDFSYFSDRRDHDIDDIDPMQRNLFALPGHKWKPLRNKLSGAFSSVKLKAMFSTSIDCGASLQNHLAKVSESQELLDVRETAASYTTNVISSVAFGLDLDCFADPDNDFRKFGRQIFKPTPSKLLRKFIMSVAPSLLRVFRLKALTADEDHFITSVVKQNLEYREKNNVVRKDFFQLLVQLRNNGTVLLDDEWETVIKGNENQKKMTLDEIKAQTFLFFIAGFETSSSTLSFCLYELAKNYEIQKRVQEEIDRISEEHDGKITYESISQMKFLDLCIDETLRKYPVLGILTRVCVNDYKIPGTDGGIIEKGTEVLIPAQALQWDEQYYEKPNRFNPERFSDENPAGKNQTKQPYYPFGDGPRNCVGLRLGKMQTKVGLVLMLQKFRFELDDGCKNTDLKYDPKAPFLAPLGGIHLRVFKRE